MTSTAHSVENENYEAPELILHGSVADITGGALAGANADNSFPAGLISVNATISL